MIKSCVTFPLIPVTYSLTDDHASQTAGKATCLAVGSQLAVLHEQAVYDEAWAWLELQTEEGTILYTAEMEILTK